MQITDRHLAILAFGFMWIFIITNIFCLYGPDHNKEFMKARIEQLEKFNKGCLDNNQIAIKLLGEHKNANK